MDLERRGRDSEWSEMHWHNSAWDGDVLISLLQKNLEHFTISCYVHNCYLDRPVR